MMRITFIISALSLMFSNSVLAAGSFVAPKVGDTAPSLKAVTQDGKPFDLKSREGKWTVLYFYPKADTPGCTKQACSFRDSLKKISGLNADVFGISADSVADIEKFHEKHSLNFTLLSDPKLNAVKSFGVPTIHGTMASRWTFIIDTHLKIRKIYDKVDPVMDVENTSLALHELQGT